eukprot:gene26305-34932_t
MLFPITSNHRMLRAGCGRQFDITKAFITSNFSSFNWLSDFFQFSSESVELNLSDHQRTMREINKLKDFLYRSQSGRKTLEKFASHLTETYPGEFSEIIVPSAAEWAVFAPNPHGDFYDSEMEMERTERFHRLEIFIGEKLQTIAVDAGVNGIDPIESENYKSYSMMNIFHAFLQFAQVSREEQLEAILSDSGIAILLFCSVFDHISVLMFPIIDLALDCRGRIQFFGAENTCYIQIGEVLTSVGELENARMRLSVQLMVLKEAIRVMKPSMSAESILLKGKIFLPPPLQNGHLTGEVNNLPFEGSPPAMDTKDEGTSAA